VRLIAAADATQVYAWGDHSLEFHRCQRCGCVTHWCSVDADADRMAVNARLIDPELLRSLRVRKLDGAKSGNYLR
jgi:hypothetical protein